MPLGDTLAMLAPAIGTLAGGPVGGAIGTLASGVIQGVGADQKRKEYDRYESTIPLQDPAQVRFMDLLQKRRRAFESGTDAMTSNRMARAGDALAQTQANITRAGRGNVGDLLRAQRVTDQAVGAAGADANRVGLSLLNMEGNLTESMANRAYGRQQDRANQLWQDYARRREDASRTTMAAVGMLPQLGYQGGGGPMAPQGAPPSNIQNSAWKNFGNMGGTQPMSPLMPQGTPLTYSPL